MAAKGPVAEWTVREQLILASAVQRSGDQNWVSVSRAVKPLVEDARPPDYFSQKNCALQYSAMLDKAKHPKRKRSSEGTPESATVQEQIVRQLTEKRIKELDSSISDTRREYYALKKEIEQIEKGELESDLPAMWEKVQAELSAKEGSESKGSRSRKSSVASATGSVADGDHPKRQKTGGAGDRSREKSSHKSPEKRSSQSSSELHTTPVLPPVKEEKPSTLPALLPDNTPHVPTATPSPSTSSTGVTPATQRSSSKKKNLESLPLISPATSAGDLSAQEESPLLCPMTVPKEEQLRETIAAAGGQLSRSLVLPLSPDMHVIVQQPNIAALSAASLPGSESAVVGETVPALTPATKDGPHEVAAVDPPVSTASVESVPPPLPPPPPPPPPPLSSGGGEAQTDTAVVVVKQETTSDAPPLSSPARPRTVAEALSSATALAVHHPTIQQPLLPPPPSLSPPVPVVQPPAIPLQRAPLLTSSSRPHLLHAPPPPTDKFISSSSSPSASPHQSPLKPALPQLTSPSSHVPQPPLPAPMTEVSSVLTDPRLSSRSATSRTSTSTQPTLQQFLDKSRGKPQTANQAPPDTGKSKSQSKSPENKGKNKPQQTTSQTTGDKEKTKSSKPPLSGQSTGDKGKGKSQTIPQNTAEKSKAKSQPTTTTTTEKPQPLPKAPVSADKVRPLIQKPSTATDHTKPPTVQTPADKTKPKSTTKSKQPTETEQKKSTLGDTLPQPSFQLPGSSRPLQECLPQPTVDIVREPWKTDSGESVKPGRVPMIKTGEKTGESGSSDPHVAPITESESGTGGRETSKSEEIAGEEKKEEKEVEVDVVTTEEKDEEKGAAVKKKSNPPSPAVSGAGSQKDKVEVSEEGKQSEPVSEVGGGVALDESMQVEAGSSRRSSISELPTSPLTTTTTTTTTITITTTTPAAAATATAGAKEELPEPEENQPRKKQARPSSSKKLWPTRSRKRKLEVVDDGVESTELESEEEPSSIVTSAAPSPAPSQGDGDVEGGGMSRKQWKKAIMLVWRHAAQHKYANLFLHPVRDDDAPGYRDVIHRPMDLSSIKRNIENGVITTDIEFQRDMLLMFQNAFMYNSSDHDVYDMAEKMRADVMQSIQDYLSTQLQLIVESSTPKVLRSRDKEGRRGEGHEEGLLTPMKKRRTRADD